MHTTLKRVLTITFIVISLLALTVTFLFWGFNADTRNDSKLAEADPMGKEFLTLYPGAVSYELNTNKSVYLNTIWGSTDLELTIPRSGDSASYTLRCYQATTNIVYDTLSGASAAMANYIKSETCFTHEPSYEQLKKYRNGQ